MTTIGTRKEFEMTNVERRELRRQVEEWVVNMLGPVEIKDLEETADIIQSSVEDVLQSELAERLLGED